MECSYVYALIIIFPDSPMRIAPNVTKDSTELDARIVLQDGKVMIVRLISMNANWTRRNVTMGFV
jgi:hypothetical protein